MKAIFCFKGKSGSQPPASKGINLFLLVTVALAFQANSSYASKTSLPFTLLTPYVSSIGVNQNGSFQSNELAANGNPHLSLDKSFGVEIGHDLMLGLPFLVLHSYGTYTNRSGLVQYNLSTDASPTPTQGTNIPTRASIFEVGYTARWRPLILLPICPFIGAGFHVGAVQLYFDGSAMDALLGGASYSQYNYSVLYGYQGEIGIDLKPFPVFGIEALVRRKFSRTYKFSTMDNTFLTFAETDFLVSAAFFW